MFYLENLKAFRPKLILYVQVDSGVTIDATLSPDTKTYLRNVAERQKGLESSLGDSDTVSKEGAPDP